MDRTNLLLNGHYLRKLHDKYIQVVCEKFDMPKIEIDILLFLHYNPTLDTAKDMVKYRFFSKSHISKALDHLQENGYVSTQREENDRRKVHLTIRSEAHPTIEEAINRQEMLKKKLSENFTDYEKKLINELIDKFMLNVQKALEESEESEMK